MARISVLCDDELFERIQRLFPWGTQGLAVRKIMEILCDRIERDGPVVLALMMQNEYDPVEGIRKRGKLL